MYNLTLPFCVSTALKTVFIAYEAVTAKLETCKEVLNVLQTIWTVLETTASAITDPWGTAMVLVSEGIEYTVTAAGEDVNAPTEKEQLDAKEYDQIFLTFVFYICFLNY